MEIEAYLKKDYTTNLVNEGRREDGRAFDEYRKLITENGYVKEKAPGSCLVQLGKTKSPRRRKRRRRRALPPTDPTKGL